MFEGTLPTLDLQIWVRGDNKVLYKYFEKKMTPNMVLHARSAIPESTRRATINQELIRRLTNTSELVENEIRVEIVDKYAQKLINSEYSLKVTREFLIGGLKGYERLLSLSKDRENPKWKPLHMSGSWNGRNRRVAKQLAKSSWYKGKVPVEPPPTNHQAGPSQEDNINKNNCGTGDNASTSQEGDDLEQNSGCHEESKGKSEKTRPAKAKKRRGVRRENITLGGLKKIEKASKRKERQKINRKMGSLGLPTTKKKRRGPPPPIRSVCFIDNSANGVLIKRMQEGEQDIGETTNIRVRMTEAAGTPLSVLLTSNNPWGVKDCERKDCVTCDQSDEVTIDCKKRNILYESICTLCNPVDEKRGRKNEISFLKAGKGIYVGESSRSLYERTREHMSDREGWKEESHQVKHWLTDHSELQQPPRFRFKLVRSFTDPMSRQLAEAVRIELRGSSILNSKSEYNRCRVPRLRVDLEGWKEVNQKPSIQKENIQCTEAADSLKENENKKRKSLGGEEKECRKKPKRIRLDKLEGWGENTNQDEEENLPEGWWSITNCKDVDSTEEGNNANTVGGTKQISIPECWLQDHQIVGDDDIDNSTTPVEDDSDVNPEKRVVEVVPQMDERKDLPAKFKFKKRGKLDKKEIKELQKTNTSMMSWLVRKGTTPMHVPQLEQEDMEWVDGDREEKLARVERKKLEWATTRLCRSVLLGTVDDAVTRGENRHLVEMMDSLVEEAWRRIEVERLVREVINSGEEIQARVEIILSEKRLEERELRLAMEREECKQRRLERIKVLQKTLMKKYEATKLKQILRMLRMLRLEDLEMEVDVVERKAIEMMEVDDEMLGVEPGRGVHESDEMLGVEPGRGVHESDVCGGVEYTNYSNTSNLSSNNQAQTTIFLGGGSKQLTWLSLENLSRKRKRESEDYDDKNKRRKRLVPDYSFSQ